MNTMKIVGKIFFGSPYNNNKTCFISHTALNYAQKLRFIFVITT